MKVDYCLPTQHSITKSRVSLAHTTSLGNSSGKKRMSDGGLGGGIYTPAIILATVAFGRERSSSVGAPFPE